MDAEPAPGEPPFTLFMQQLWADQEAGRRRPLWEYLRLFPGDDENITREYFQSARGTGLLSERPSLGGAALARPQIVGQYRLIRQLGSGGQGTVHLAEDLRLRRKVALKILAHGALGSTAALDRFRREAEVTSRLDHPGICTVYDAGQDGNTPYIAMRYVEGETLAHRVNNAHQPGTVAEQKTFIVEIEGHTPAAPPTATDTGAARMARDDVREIARLFEQACRALHVAHEAGIVHRDIKPGNIMVTPDSAPVILDFGLARELGGDGPTLTDTGEIFGTPFYMSPEQLAAQNMSIDRRTDIWSMGVSLYEALTLKRPFEGVTREGLCQAILTRDPADPSRLNPAIPRDLGVIVTTTLEKDRDRRYQTAADLAEDLRRLLASEPIAARPVGPVGRFARWSRREPAKAALLAVLLIALPLIAALVTARWKDRPQIEKARLTALAQEMDEVLSEASFELAERDPRRALELYQRVLDSDVASAEALSGVVLSRLRLNDPAGAQHALDAGERLIGHGLAARVLQADIFQALGREDDAAKLRRELPPPADALGDFVLAQHELQKGEAGESAAFSRALHHATQAILDAPGPRLPYFELRLHAAGHARNREAVLDSIAALRRRWPDSPNALTRSAFALGVLSDPRLAGDAAAIYERVLATRRTDPVLWANYAGALSDLGRNTEAVRAAEEALRLEPSLSSAHVNLGVIYSRLGQEADALASFMAAIKIDPTNAFARINAGAMLDNRGDQDGAIKLFQEALTIDPSAAVVHYNLATALAKKHDLDGALAEARRAADLEPTNTEYRVRIGMVLSLLGRAEESAAAYQEAVRMGSKDAQAWYNLAGAQRDSGNLRDAAASYRQATMVEPTHAEAWCNLGLVLGLIGSFREGADALKRGNELGHARREWKYPSDDWLSDMERLAGIAGRLDAIAAGSFPDETDELIDTALVAAKTGRVWLAWRCFDRAITDEPVILQDARRRVRYEAAVAGVQVAAGAGTDSAAVDATQRTTCRARALEWLKADLSMVASEVQSGAAPPAIARQVLNSWARDPRFASVRDVAVLSALPDAERAGWRALWDEVDRLRH